MAKKNDGMTINFATDRETKNTVLYKAVTPEGETWEDSPVDRIYVRKTAFDTMPLKLVLTIIAG